MPLYDKNILLYCGVDNKSNFKIVTDNNVPKNLTGLTPYFNITDIESEETVLSRPMTVTNASRGEAEIDITQADLYSIAEEAIEIGAKVLWGQIGVVNYEAARLAENAGLKVVMNRCPKIELFRPFWKPRLDLKL